MTEKIDGVAQRYPALGNDLLEKEWIEKEKNHKRLTEEFQCIGKCKNWFYFPSHCFYHSFWACKNTSGRFKMFLFYLAENTHLPPPSRLAPLPACSLKNSAGLHSSSQKPGFLCRNPNLKGLFCSPLPLELEKTVFHSSTGTIEKCLPPPTVHTP